MNRTAAYQLAAGALLLVAGVGLMHVPAAIVLGGLLLVATGVLSLERPTRGAKDQA